MVDTMLSCDRVQEDGTRCDGVSHLEGEGRERVLKYRCKKCGNVFTRKRGVDAGRHILNLGPGGDLLRDSVK